MIKVNIIILNYNGEKLITECLPSIIKAKHTSKYPVRITVIDNESADRSLDVLEQYNEEIDIVKCTNRVFCSYNEVVKNQDEEIAILMNNDIRVDPGFIDPMVKVFEEKEDAYMIAPKCYDFEGSFVEGGRSKGFIKFGWFGAVARYEGWEKELGTFNYTFQTGFGAVRRDRFIELGGYDDLYLPGRLEDADICFRAWKKGWKSYYQPGSVVYHKGGTSFKKKFGVQGISSIDARNSLLFFWKNIFGSKYWMEHILFLPARIGLWLIRGDFSSIKGVFQAFGKIRDVAGKRAKEKKQSFKLSDHEIFNIFR
ncbi:MAG: glycosyltransferase family 2 protein [Candidatus Omnitrophota bacterium]